MLDQNDVQIIKDLIKDGVKEGTAHLATKDELTNLATKDDLTGLATKDELTKLASAIKDLPTKEEVREIVIDTVGPLLEQNVMSTMDEIFNDIKAIRSTMATEGFLNEKINLIIGDTAYRDQAERKLIVSRLKEKKVINEEEAREMMEFKIASKNPI